MSAVKLDVEKQLSMEFQLPRKLPKAVLIEVLGISQSDLSRRFLTHFALKQAFGDGYLAYINRKCFYGAEVEKVATILQLRADEIQEIKLKMAA